MQSTPELLIVEDDKNVSSLLSEALQEHFTVHKARTIWEAVKHIESHSVEVVVLDLLLPDGNGLDLYPAIKEADPATKVIVLTKKVEIQDRLTTFHTGVDDYLPKPFFPQELVSRALRLVSNKENRSASAFSLDHPNKTALINNTAIRLSNTEFLLMEYLLSYKGVRTTQGILKYLNTKRGKAMNEKALIVSITRLRNKFECSTGMRVIKNRYGLGYYLSI